MNWKRGFKRITIVTAVACGIVASFLPVQRYRYARDHWWSVNDPLVIRQPTEEDLTYFERWQQHNKVFVDANSHYAIFPDYTGDQTLMTVCNNYFERQRRSFWYNLPIAKLIGMAVLCGLGGAAISYLGLWLIIWWIGYKPIRWIILGFREDKPTDEQKQ